MNLIFAELHNESGLVEVTVRKFHDGQELPDGQWSVCRPGQRAVVAEESQMPERWQKQLEQRRRFGKTL